MREIRRFDLEGDSMVIWGPFVKFLTTQVNGDKIVIWAELETDLDITAYRVTAFEEREQFSDPDYCYLNTVQDVGGLKVLHIYYKRVI